MFKKIITIITVICSLGLSVVGCGENTEQQQEQYEQQEPQDKSVNDYYTENKQTDLQIAKENIQQEFNEHGITSEITIDNEHNMLLIHQSFSLNEISQAIVNGTWGEITNDLVTISLRYYETYGVNICFIISATDNNNIYLAVANGEIEYNVENEMGKK